jgi:hypothetical protein
VPHSIRLPQPSVPGPSWTPWSTHVSGTQLDRQAPHCPATPSTPHASPAGQFPQSRTPPQPSGAGPHATPAAAHVVGRQGSPQTFGIPSPPQV